jgi:hypothetical protein
VRVAIYVVYLRSMHSAIQHKESNPNTYKPESIEKRLFKCKSCGYEVQVYGETYFDYGCYNYIATFSCNNCKILFEGIISQQKFVFADTNEKIKGFSPEILKEDIRITFDLCEKESIGCLYCGKSDYKVWNKETGVCPKCNGEMIYKVLGKISVKIKCENSNI